MQFNKLFPMVIIDGTASRIPVYNILMNPNSSLGTGAKDLTPDLKTFEQGPPADSSEGGCNGVQKGLLQGSPDGVKGSSDVVFKTFQCGGECIRWSSSPLPTPVCSA